MHVTFNVLAEREPNDAAQYYEHEQPGLGTAFIAEWYQVKGDKIAAIRVVFDARPFAAMFAK